MHASASGERQVERVRVEAEAGDAKRGQLVRCIQRVADDGVVNSLEVNANLVRPASFWAHEEQGEPIGLADDFKPRYCVS